MKFLLLSLCILMLQGCYVHWGQYRTEDPPPDPVGNRTRVIYDSIDHSTTPLVQYSRFYKNGNETMYFVVKDSIYLVKRLILRKDVLSESPFINVKDQKKADDFFKYNFKAIRDKTPTHTSRRVLIEWDIYVNINQRQKSFYNGDIYSFKNRRKVNMLHRRIKSIVKDSY